MEWRPRPADVLVPAGILALGLVELATARPEGWGYGAVLEAVTALLLVGRRRWPLVTCTVAAVVMLWMPWAGPQLDDIATPILFLAVICYSLGRWLADLRGLVGLAVLMAMFLLDYLVVDTRPHGFGDIVFVSALVVPPYVFGRIVRRLDEQGRLLAAQQEQLRDQAVRDERDRIARELHDVIAHSVSAMVVQTAAAQDLVRSAPDRAVSVLEQVAETGRQTLAETGRLLHLVRDEADELGLAPAPGLAQLPDLIDSMRAAGLDLDAELHPPTAVPGGVDVSAYRIVQEALTNALRYGAGPTRLCVRAEQGVLRISCRNPVAEAATVDGAGLGLQGMAERVRLLGGSLEHRRVDDRFELTALVPLGTAS